MSLVNVGQMDKLTVFALGIIAGIVLLILAFGFSRSPKASPGLGAPNSRSVTTSSGSPIESSTSGNPYEKI